MKTVRDYKRLRNNDEGINTGSMRCYTPVKLSGNQKNIMRGYAKNPKSALKETKPNFTGIFAIDLICTKDKVFNL